MTGTELSFAQVEALWQQAAQSLYSSGRISQAQLSKAIAATPTMAAIAAAESALGGNLGPSSTGDYGLFQINSYWHPQYDVQSLLDNNFYNATAAVQIYLSSGFGAWSTYNNGEAQNYLGKAQAAFSGAASSATGTTSSASGTAAATTPSATSAKALPLTWSPIARLLIVLIGSAMVFGGLYAAKGRS